MLAAAAVRVERGAAFSSRGCMWSGGVPAGLTAIHRVVLVGDRLSWERPRAGWGQEARARVRGEWGGGCLREEERHRNGIMTRK